ncbi:hypothetical protein K457DRAFT_900753, partial [Linnemannia elongata AG-77]
HLQKFSNLYKFSVPVGAGTRGTRGSRGTKRHTVDPLSIADSFAGLDDLVVTRAIDRLEDLNVSTVNIADGSGLGAGETDTRADVAGGSERVHPIAVGVANLNGVIGQGDTGACGC